MFDIIDFIYLFANKSIKTGISLLHYIIVITLEAKEVV